MSYNSSSNQITIIYYEIIGTIIGNIVVLIYKQIFFMIMLLSEEAVCQQMFVRNQIAAISMLTAKLVILSCVLLSADTLKSLQLYLNM